MGVWKYSFAIGASVVGLGCGVAPEEQMAVGDETVGAQQQSLGVIPSNSACLSTGLVAPISTIHVAVNGNDANDGTTAATAVATLAGAQSKIPANYGNDYQIIVHGGEYRGQKVNWTRTSSTHRIRIEAATNEVPIFDGRDPGSSAGGRQPTFFFLSPVNATSPIAANIVVKGLTIRYYVQTGFSLGQGPPEGNQAGVAQTCTTLVDNTLSEIGSLHGDCVVPSSGPNAGVNVINRPNCVNGVDDGFGCSCIGYGAIDLQHSGRNSFKDNKVINAENLSSNIGLIHAFYVAYHSTDNLIENNYARNISGNPFKFRDFSSNNEVINNYAERAGRNGFFTDSPNNSSEGASVNNSLSGNLVTFSRAGEHMALTISSSTSPPSFILGANQSTGRYYQGDTPAQEDVTAAVSADVDGDGKEEVFVALYYPELGLSKVVYSVGGSTALSEVAYSSTAWRVTALAAGKFGNSANPNVIAAFWNGGTQTQVQRGLVDTDGTYRFGAGTLLNSSGSSFWKVTAMAGGQVAGTTAPNLFVAVSHDGVQEIHRGDGLSPPSGSTNPGVSDGTALYSGANWEIPALAVGPVDGSVVKLVSAFHYVGSGSPLNRLYLGSGSGAGSGATDGGAFFRDGSTTLIRSLAIGTFDGSNSRLAWGANVGGVGKVYLTSLSGSTIVPQATELYTSSHWDIAAVARSETRSGGGDELITAFHTSSTNQVWSGDGTTATSGATTFDNYNRWP